jgi:hypothetical protein
MPKELDFSKEKRPRLDDFEDELDELDDNEDDDDVNPFDVE